MGETLGIARNVFEKAERERDRKERLQVLEDWKKEKSLRLKKAGNLQAASSSTAASKSGAGQEEEVEDAGEVRKRKKSQGEGKEGKCSIL